MADAARGSSTAARCCLDSLLVYSDDTQAPPGSPHTPSIGKYGAHTAIAVYFGGRGGVWIATELAVLRVAAPACRLLTFGDVISV